MWLFLFVFLTSIAGRLAFYLFEHGSDNNSCLTPLTACRTWDYIVTISNDWMPCNVNETYFINSHVTFYIFNGTYNVWKSFVVDLGNGNMSCCGDFTCDNLTYAIIGNGKQNTHDTDRYK